MTEHDPALVERAADAVVSVEVVRENPAHLHPGTCAEHIARAVLDAVAPAIREAALLEAAGQLSAGCEAHQEALIILRDMAAQQREETSDG